MADPILDMITEFASSASYRAIPEPVGTAALDRVVDSVGCALGALGRPEGCPTARVGESIAPVCADDGLGGRVIGSGAARTTADAATFVNGCLIRDLDFNDAYPGHHPSDCLGALIAIAGARNLAGSRLLAAMVISYEISIRIMKAARLNRKGWDNGYATGIGTAAGVSHLLGLEHGQLRQAVALTATSNVPMRATRAGQLSMWKGAATAQSTRLAVLNAQLAAHGMTGPEAPFTGRHGLADLITGDLELDPFPAGNGGRGGRGGPGGDYLLPQTKTKYWPVVYNMQALVWAGIELRSRLAGRAYRKVTVYTYWSAWRESGSEPAKWRPTTRETADHSAPYILAQVLRHGRIDSASFSEETVADHSVWAEMDRIGVEVDEDLESAYPDQIEMRVLAEDSAGDVHEVRIENPLGHEANPMSRDDIDAKFRGLAGPALGADRVEPALSAWRGLRAATVGPALDAVLVRTRT
jgi:2-methylcitrate dehydratase